MRSVLLRTTLFAVACAACKESMHPRIDDETESQQAPTPAHSETKPQPTAAPTQPAPVAENAAKKEVTSDGYEVIRANPHEGEKQDGDKPSGDGANVAVKAPPGWKVAQPPDTPDPHGGNFTLAEALKGLPTKGTLGATIHTSLGAFQCDLFDDKAPKSVANFVGLARGLRKFWSAKDHAWVARPYYNGTVFHRVIPEFMIQGGDWAGDGTGAMYFTVPDELHPSLKHDRGGLLCMANRGPNTNEAQFFITEAAAPHLDSSYTIFGECSPVELVKRIARVPQSGPPNNHPLTPVVIERVTIERRAAPAIGGKAAASSPVPPGRAVEVAAPKAATP